MNVFLSKFYNDVKDASWPTVETYADYLSLPDRIRNECENVHGLNDRLREIEDPDYWRNLIIDVYRYKNLGYVSIPKCASTYYTSFFKTNGWEKTSIGKLDDSVNLFGLIMDPTMRWLKGMTQFVISVVGVNGATDQTLEKIMELAVTPDIHTIPYRTYMGRYLEKINWIPMSILDDQEIKNCMMSFFKKHGHDIQLPTNDERIHKSNDKKLELFNRIKNLYIKNFNSDAPISPFYVQIALADDIKFYQKLLKSFDPTFSKSLG